MNQSLVDPETGEKLEKGEIARRLTLMTSTPGWKILESYILRQADRCSQIDSIQTDQNAVEQIAFQVRVQQSKRDAYRGIISYVKNGISKGGQNGNGRNDAG